MTTTPSTASYRGVLNTSGRTATAGYGAGGPTVPPGLIRAHGLRRGDDLVVERGELVLLNGAPPSGERPEFDRLTPLHPDERLVLETGRLQLTTRVLDLVMPLGKGQRALVVAPPRTGKTSVLQAVAHSVATNHPEAHLMVLLTDERPEEVTDMRRSVRGEVLASTFDRSPAEHTALAELAIERAKRLVEAGQDVVLLLDSLTRLGRAYNLAARNSGRVLSGGVDAAALHPMKRILGAARNTEDGGSLTIVATALVGTGSLADTVFFEELKGTGNAELRLDRTLADHRVFPAIDVIASGTRRDDLIVPAAELAVMTDVRRALANQDPRRAAEQFLEQVRTTRSNAEFVARVSASLGAPALRAA
ncbi:transcription termination factor Rho [Actinokineospora bangkokensis]|uniref:Transcription termination factor Rho n=1 Tax=Actinokineospora bangkokensis TaxID=1193682 RepID=A0A1Q9LMT0_9PSEU|nr:transcription termination factor Rho [Actinokineospora bangkokensis]OLR93321.1 transcription termination factor Rho [Actinokineospora bangkokensis]